MNMNGTHRWPLETRYGQLTVIVDGIKTCTVTSTSQCGNGHVYLKIRGIPLSVAHCFLVHEAGEWRTAYETGTKTPRRWSINRVEGPPNVEASVSQIRDTKNAVLEAVTAFHMANPAAFVEAERDDLAGLVESRKVSVERARKSVVNEEAGLQRAIDLLAEFNREYPS